MMQFSVGKVVAFTGKVQVALAAASAFSFPGIPTYAGTHQFIFICSE